MVISNQYYTKPFTGGAANFSGINYQTAAALFCMFESALGCKFKGISLEKLNDFILHDDQGSISAQVKKTGVSFKKVKDIISGINSTEHKRALIISTNFDTKTKELFKIVNEYKESLKLVESGIEEPSIKYIRQKFNEVLTESELDSLKSLLLNTEIKEISKENLDNGLYIFATEFSQKNQKVVKVFELINQLKSIFMNYSEDRRTFFSNNLYELLEKHTYIEYGNGLISLKPSSYSNSDQSIINKYKEKYREAEELISEKEYKKAFEIFNSLNQIFASENLIIQCSMLLNYIGDYNQSIVYIERVLRENSNNAGALIIKANNLAELKLFDKATEIFLHILDVNQDIPECYYNLAYIYSQQGNNQLAMDFYKKCLKVDENFINAHINISHLYFVHGRMDAAKNHSIKALKINPQCYQAYARLGEIYRYYADFNNAISYFIRCLKIDPNNFEALLGIAISYICVGNRLSSKTHFEILLTNYLSVFMENGKKSPGGILITDFGESYYNFILLSIINSNQAILNINDVTMDINLNVISNNFSVGLYGTEDNEADCYPYLSFSYENKEYFENIVDELKSYKKSVSFDYYIIDSENEIYLEIFESREVINITLTIPTKDKVKQIQLYGSLFNIGDGYNKFKEYIYQFHPLILQLNTKDDQISFIINNFKLV